jgi:hypothetical protein
VPAPTRVAAAAVPAASRYEAPTPVPVRRKKRSFLPALVAAALVALAVTGVVLATVVAGGDGGQTVAESTGKGGQSSVVTRKVTVTAPGTTVRATVTQKQTPTSSVAVVETPPTTASSGGTEGADAPRRDRSHLRGVRELPARELARSLGELRGRARRPQPLGGDPGAALRDRRGAGSLRVAPRASAGARRTAARSTRGSRRT